MNHELPPQAPPRRSASTAGVVVLTGALIFSLLLNATFGILLQEERAENEALAGRLPGATGSPSAPARAVDLTAIEEQVERLRELRFKGPVESELLDRSTLQDRVRTLLDEDLSQEEFDDTQRVLETLGVVEAGADVWTPFRQTYEEQVGGYYDDESGELVVLAEQADDPSPFTRVLLAHELTHALTDQHFDLSRRNDLSDRGREDEAAAFLALVEGDATLLMVLYAQEVLTADEQAQAALEEGQGSSASFESLPRFFQESFLFPYTEGLSFAQALYERGGFAAIDRAYAEPPRSTEEILHPERYLRGEPAPRRPSLNGVGRALGRGWERIDDGDVGEFDLRLIADIQARSGGLTLRESRIAAEGWGGGRYAGFGSGDDTFTVMRLAFDGEAEAREATRLFSQWLPLRFGNIGSELETGTDDGRGWNGRDGSGMVLRSGDEMLVLLGPDERTVRDARGAFDGF